MNYNVIKKLVCVCLSSFLSACAQHVYFFDTINSENTTIQDSHKIIPIYVDVFGSIYPESGLPEGFSPARRDDGSLMKMSYKDNKFGDLCKQAVNGETRQICDSLLSGEKDWDEVQSDLWNQKAAQILSAFSPASKNRAIVLLIHGFNVASGGNDDAFDITRDRIVSLDQGKTDIVFVHVNWDGLKNFARRAWSKAQASGPLVGFEMRQLLNAIDDQNKGGEIAVRTVSHSSGAFVVGALFGNPIAALPLLGDGNEDGDKPYDDFYRNRYASEGKMRIPQIKDLRIGLLAAATPSNTFVGKGNAYTAENREGKAGLLTESATLITSLNPRDNILKKFIGIGSWSIIGASGLGVEKRIFCLVKDATILEERNITVIGLDFERKPPDTTPPKAHGFEHYVSQYQAEDFFELLWFQSADSSYDLDCGH